MSDVLVFAPESTLEVRDEQVDDVLVLRTVPGLTVQESGDGDFLLIDGQVTTATVEVNADHLLVQGEAPVEVVERPADTEFTVLVTEPINPAVPGPQGPPGPHVFQSYSFAVPVLLWQIDHNLNTLGVLVETYDINGDEVETNVRIVSTSRIEIDWYYPTAGTARLFA